MQVALIIGAHHEEMEAEIPILPNLLSRAGWRVVILNPIGGWNWVPSLVRYASLVGRLGSDAPEKIKKEAFEAAKILGCEKVIWDYETPFDPKLWNEVSRRLAELLVKVGPELVFIHWPLDNHPDHRIIARISRHTLIGVQRFSFFVERTDWNPTWSEVYAYQAGIAQTYDFWPDALVVGDEEAMRTARKALEAFRTYGSSIFEGWWQNLLAKTTYWGTLAGGRPAEAYKFLGPHLPTDVPLLKKALGNQIRFVTSQLWLQGREFRDSHP